jgi:hypothetical protein
MASRTQKVGMIRRAFQILGLVSSSNGHVDSITETIARMDVMEDRVERIEAVTMSLSLDELTEEEKREMGLVE